MSWRGALLSLCALVSAASTIPLACATGSAEDEGDGGDETSAATGGEGGLGGSGGAGGEAGAGGEGGTGGMAPACAGDPCKLVAPQCGCKPGERCDVQGNSVVCETAGDKKIGEACDDDCEAGLTCFKPLALNAKLLCHNFCDQDSQCNAPGGLCVWPVGGGLGKLCSTNCDPISNTGCSVPGTKCAIGRESQPPNRLFTHCGGAGTVKHGEPCIGSGSCEPGTECFEVSDGMTTQKLCLAWCNVGGGNCPVDSACSQLNPPQIIGSIHYGGCVPFSL